MLGDLLERRFKIDWKQSKTLTIRELSFRDWEEMIEIETIAGDENRVREAIDKKIKFVLKCLNRNLEHIKITEEEVKSVNMVYINALWAMLIDRMHLVVNDPN